MKSCKIYGYQLQDWKEYATVQGGLLCNIKPKTIKRNKIETMEKT